MAQFAGDRFDVSDGKRYRQGFGYTGDFGGITVRATSDPSDDNGTIPADPTATPPVLQQDVEGVTTFGIKGTFAGFEVGYGQEDEDVTIGVRYGMGDWTFAAHATEWDLATTTQAQAAPGEDSSVALLVGWSGGNWSASYQTEELNNRTKSQFDGAYNLGGGAALKLRVRMDDIDADEYTRLLLTVGF